MAIEPNRAFILCHQVSTDETSCPGTWQFVLTPIGEGATRLILRARSGPSPTRSFDIVAELGYFVLTRGMLLGIKQRAESMAA